jgi:hypothetical protein
MDWQDVVRETHRLGLEERAKQPFEGGGIPFRLRPYMNPETHGGDLEWKEGLDDTRRRVLQGIVILFRVTKLRAALVQSDVMMVDSPAFMAYFGLSTKLIAQQYQEEYLHILNERFDGTVANLPRELWQDCIVTAIKGPKVAPFMLCTPYHGGGDGEVVYEESVETDGGEWGVLPDWWDETVN